MTLSFSDKHENYLLHFLRRYSGIILCIILFFALTLRILALLAFKESLYSDFLVCDETVSHRWAMKLIDKSTGAVEIWDFAPFPVYIMALIYKIFSPNPMYIRIFNLILGVFTCYFAYLAARELKGKLTGLFACFITGFCKPFIFFSITIMKTSLSLFLFSLVLWLFLAILNRYSWVKMLSAGIIIGLLLNVRSNCILMIPIILAAAALIYFRKKSSIRYIAATAAIYCTGLVISLTPFIIRNYQISGTFAITPAGGFNLYLGNNLDNPYPYYRPVSFASSSPSKQAVQFTIEAAKRSGKKLSHKQASSYWTYEIFRQTRIYPVETLQKIILKTCALFNRLDSADNFHIGFISRFIPFFKIPFFELWMILPWAMAGMAVCIRSEKCLSLAVLLFSYAVTLVLFFSNIRLRLPILLVLIPFAVMGVHEFFLFVRTRDFRMSFIYLFIAAAFFTIEFFPVKGSDDLTAHYNTHASLLFSKGLKKEALECWEKSSSLKGSYSVFADLALANYSIARGNIRKASLCLEKIPGNSFAGAAKHEKIGDVMMKQRKLEEAAKAYEKSLEINSGQKQVISKLIRIYKRTDKQKAEQMIRKLSYISLFYNSF